MFGARTTDRDEPTNWQTRLAQYDAVCAWGQPNHSLLERVSAIDKPVFVASGDSDPMILPRYSYLLAGLIPGAHLKIYPDAAHGFLFQHHAEFARRRRRIPGRRMSARYLSGVQRDGHAAPSVGVRAGRALPCPAIQEAASVVQSAAPPLPRPRPRLWGPWVESRRGDSNSRPLRHE